MLPHVLVIDDDTSLRDTLRRGLSYEGFSVSIAADGREGLKMARQHPADLVVLDILMP